MLLKVSDERHKKRRPIDWNALKMKESSITYLASSITYLASSITYLASSITYLAFSDRARGLGQQWDF